jgi:hypothetical protein
MSYGMNQSSPYQEMFSICPPRSPMLTGRQNYYVTGGVRK